MLVGVRRGCGREKLTARALRDSAVIAMSGFEIVLTLLTSERLVVLLVIFFSFNDAKLNLGADVSIARYMSFAADAGLSRTDAVSCDRQLCRDAERSLIPAHQSNGLEPL